MIPGLLQIRFLCANRRPFFNLSSFISMDPSYAGLCNPYIIPSDDCKEREMAPSDQGRHQ